MTAPADHIGPHNALDTEPVAVALTGLAGLVDVGLIAAVALDWLDLTTEQTAAVVAFVTATTALVGAVLRANVYSPATVEDLTAPGDEL